MIASTQTFVSMASDGLDNTEAAGAIVDLTVRRQLAGQRPQAEKSLAAFDEFAILQKAGALVMTGPTQANVSDLSFLLTE